MRCHLNIRKDSRVAYLSILGRSIRLLSGPITLLIISKELSSTELAFYYTFFSVISLQQLAELGIGHVIKQYISHSFDNKNGVWTYDSKKKIRKYYRLANVWFLGVSIFILLGVSFIGFLYFYINTESSEWIYPWFLLIIGTTLSSLISPRLLLIDGIQKQEVYLVANLISGLISSICLWVFLSQGFGLYSVGLSSLFSALILMLLIHKTIANVNTSLKVVTEPVILSVVFKEIFPLLSRVSIVWGVGFLFWNSFNLISFATLPHVEAGEIIFAIALCRAGFGISESITQGQTTIFSNLIGNNETKKSIDLFKKYSLYSLLILISGYSVFLIFWFMFPSFYIFDKLPEKIVVIQIFIFFIIQLYKMLRANFVRCFKIEPFVNPSIFESIMLPITFYVSSKFFVDYIFILPILTIICSGFWFYKIEKQVLGSDYYFNNIENN